MGGRLARPARHQTAREERRGEVHWAIARNEEGAKGVGRAACLARPSRAAQVPGHSVPRGILISPTSLSTSAPLSLNPTSLISLCLSRLVVVPSFRYLCTYTLSSPHPYHTTSAVTMPETSSSAAAAAPAGPAGIGDNKGIRFHIKTGGKSWNCTLQDRAA